MNRLSCFFWIFCLPCAAVWSHALVICAVFQNEEFFLEEWLAYHQVMGVDHFYLYNNLSTDRSLEILAPYIHAGIVDLIEWPVLATTEREYVEKIQLPTYNHALTLVKGVAKWAAFIDIDEFIVPNRGERLVDLLDDYSSYAALAINWQIYGTSGLDQIPQGKLLTESLVWKGDAEGSRNLMVKLIVQPTLVAVISHPHAFDYQTGYGPVNSAFESAPSLAIGVQPVQISRLQINHYWFGTELWFIQQKLPRRKRWGISLPDSYLPYVISSFNQIYDGSILQFIPQLKQQLTLRCSHPY